jgi:hypothetical protein
MEHWPCPRERGWGKEMRPQHRNPSKQAQQKATSKARQVVDYRADLLNLRAAFKLKLSHLTGEGADQAAAAEGWDEEINFSDYPAWSGKATSPHNFNLTGRQKKKHYSQANHLARPLQSFCLYANTRTGCQRSKSELKQRLTFYCSWT